MTGTEDGGRHLGVALLVIATAQLMVVLDATVVTVALPRIQAALGFSGSGPEWVVNAYALTLGGLLLPGGRAGDLLGRRRMFVTGLLLFSAASLAGGFATSQAGLLAGGLLMTYASWRWCCSSTCRSASPSRSPPRPCCPAPPAGRAGGQPEQSLRPGAEI